MRSLGLGYRSMVLLNHTVTNLRVDLLYPEVITQIASMRALLEHVTSGIFDSDLVRAKALHLTTGTCHLQWIGKLESELMIMSGPPFQ